MLRIASLTLASLAVMSVSTVVAPPATSVVVGTIADPTTHAPLRGAVVAAAGGADSAIVDASGRYVLRGVPRDVATLTVRKDGYLDLVIPNLIVETDTLRFDAELHTNPVSRMNSRGNLPEFVMLVRFNRDSLIGTIGRDSMYLKPLADSIFSIDVLKTRTIAVGRYGPTASGGVIRVIMNSAIKFPFAEFGDR